MENSNSKLLYLPRPERHLEVCVGARVHVEEGRRGAAHLDRVHGDDLLLPGELVQEDVEDPTEAHGVPICNK